MKKNRIIISLVAGISLLSIAIYFLYVLFSPSSYIGGPKSEEYYDWLENRLSFGTVRCENIMQWDTVKSRIDHFLIEFPEYVVPDTTNPSHLTKYYNSDGLIKSTNIYFENDPVEVYDVSFGFDVNYIDNIYRLDSGEFVKYDATKFDDVEKNRIRIRLEQEVLDSIDWKIQQFVF
jgi:predicted nucleotidyltransferase